MTRTRTLAALPLAASVALAAQQRGSLSNSGALAATAVGAIAFASGWETTRALLTFFLTSTALSHLADGSKRSLPQRTAIQVLANGGLATLCSALNLKFPGDVWPSCAAGALAAATADTWATELGQRYGGQPRLIVNGRTVPSGTSGGVTAIGLAAATFGAFTQASTWRPTSPLATTAAGFLGALADSLLGATLQARYRCEVCKTIVERSAHCDRPATLIRGLRWMTNDTVNLAATIVGAAVQYGLRPLTADR